MLSYICVPGLLRHSSVEPLARCCFPCEDHKFPVSHTGNGNKQEKWIYHKQLNPGYPTLGLMTDMLQPREFNPCIHTHTRSNNRQYSHAAMSNRSEECLTVRRGHILLPDLRTVIQFNRGLLNTRPNVITTICTNLILRY